MDWHAFIHFMGIDNMAGMWYGFWSGFGSVIVPPILTSAPIVFVLLRKHNCHVKRCWRLGRHSMTHPVTGAALIVCRPHHVDDHVLADDLREPGSSKD